MPDPENDIKYAPAPLRIEDMGEGINKYSGQCHILTHEEFLKAIKDRFDLEAPTHLLESLVEKAFEYWMPAMKVHQKVWTTDEVLHAFERNLAGDLRAETACGYKLPKRRKLLSNHRDTLVRYLDALDSPHSVPNFRVLIKAFLKDEMREVGKATRNITVPQAHLWLAMAKLYGWLYNYFKDTDNATVFGIDDTIGSWTHHFRDFDKNPEVRTYSTDLGKQDARQMAAEIRWALKLCGSDYVGTQYEELAQFVIENCYEFKQVIDAYGNVLLVCNGGPSGHFATILFNCLQIVLKKSISAAVCALLRVQNDCSPGQDKIDAYTTSVPCVHPMKCCGDDTVWQPSAACDHTHIFEEVVKLTNHQLTYEDTTSLDGTRFLSKRLLVNSLGQIVPVYDNLSKCKAAITHYNGRIVDYMAKLSSFKDLLRYAPPNSINENYLIFVDMLLRRCMIKYPKYIRVPYKPLRELRSGVIFQMEEEGFEKMNTNRPSKSARAASAKKAQTKATRKVAPRPKPQIRTNNKQEETRRKPIPKKNTALTRAVNKNMATEALIKSMIDPDYARPIPSDNPSSTRCMFSVPYEPVYESSKDSGYFALAFTPYWRESIWALDLSNDDIVIGDYQQDGQLRSYFTTPGDLICPNAPLQSMDGMEWVSTNNIQANYVSVPLNTNYAQKPYFPGIYTQVGAYANFPVTWMQSSSGAPVCHFGYYTVTNNVRTKYQIVASTPFAPNTPQIVNLPAATFFPNILAADGWNFYCEVQVGNAASGIVSVQFNRNLIERQASYSWKRYPWGSMGSNSDPATQQNYQALLSYMNAYPKHFVNTYSFLAHTTNSGVGQSGLTSVIRRIPSGERPNMTNDPGSLYTIVSAIPKQTSNSQRLSDADYYLKDRTLHWEPIPTNPSEIFGHSNSVLWGERFYPYDILVVKNPTFNLTGTSTTISTVVKMTIKQCWEFEGTSPLGSLYYPPSGLTQYRAIYADVVKLYTGMIGENPNHFKRLITTAKKLAENEAIQEMAWLLFNLAKVGLTVGSIVL